MMHFATRTGLVGHRPPHRYLWTDAFAVCNFLGLGRKTGDARYAELARTLIDQVHRVLAHHRGDDHRTGWLSGLDDETGPEHPTVGGLRIGKPRSERGANEPSDPATEDERDGQYFHYLTRWMLALARFGLATGSAASVRWARELANTAHARFVAGARGARHMFWKLSTDLSRPLVDSTGQHDPLDGLVTCLELEADATTMGLVHLPALGDAISAFTGMVDGQALSTADPLGLGCLLIDAHRLSRLPRTPSRLLTTLLEAAADGVELYAGLHTHHLPDSSRLAFRELGLAIGLAALARIPRASLDLDAQRACRRLDVHATLRGELETFWLHAEHRATRSWTEHADINDVMLATCLCPDGLMGSPHHGD